ncbi:MAG: DUF308 domain-containing protein [Phycisphaerae bacterium]|nr:DUF308 domain-containing protein [Phycisphaerae bacterium]
MHFQWSSDSPSGFWLGPALLGVLLIVIGVLLYVWPQLLAYVVAGIFILTGGGLLATAWRMRRRVTYQRFDNRWEAHDSDYPQV